MQPITAMPSSLKETNDLQERIRRRAHELYEQRGRVDGLASDDWLQAEVEIRESQKQRNAKAAKASK